MTVSPSTTAVRGPTRTDLSALKFNQSAVVLVTLLAITLMLPALTLVLGVAMLTSALRPELSPLRAAYQALGSRFGLKPDVAEEDPRTHHFAQGVGGTFLLVSALLTLSGLTAAGQVLGLLVVFLAALNLSKKICMGCLMYFQYRRMRYALLSR